VHVYVMHKSKGGGGEIVSGVVAVAALVFA
jgi:hypothetical protein